MTAYQPISVEISGRVYQIKSKDDPAYIAKLVKMVNDRTAQVEKSTQTIDSLRVADLTALNLADAYCRLKQEYEQQIESLEREQTRLQNMIDQALKKEYDNPA